jgi:trk system potassium uptake protein TrkA
MFVLIVGCGRVGSGLARRMLSQEHTVSCLDQAPEAHARRGVGLEGEWEDQGGMFTVGAALESGALETAGIREADAFVAATNGDNTNIVIAQIAAQRYKVDRVVARILDPARAEFYRERGMEIVCPTRVAVEMLEVSLGNEPAGKG